VSVALPETTLVDPASLGRAQRNLQTHTSPAADTDFTLTLDPRYVWRFLSVYCTLTTDGTAANREVVLQYLDGNSSVFDAMGASTTVPASSTYTYTFSAFQSVAEFPVNTGIIVPLHPVFLEGGLKVRLHLVNGQTGDTLTTIRSYSEQYFTDYAR
jgi:hypothetical protein